MTKLTKATVGNSSLDEIKVYFSLLIVCDSLVYLHKLNQPVLQLQILILMR